MLTLAQQLELYTSLRVPDWLQANADFHADPVQFLNTYRNNWAFVTADVRRHLEGNPALVDEYFRYSATLKGAHDKAVLREAGAVFVVCWLDHGVPRDEQRFGDRLDAVLRWLELRYMN